MVLYLLIFIIWIIIWNFYYNQFNYLIEKERYSKSIVCINLTHHVFFFIYQSVFLYYHFYNFKLYYLIEEYSDIIYYKRNCYSSTLLYFIFSKINHNENFNIKQKITMLLIFINFFINLFLLDIILILIEMPFFSYNLYKLLF